MKSQILWVIQYIRLEKRLFLKGISFTLLVNLSVWLVPKLFGKYIDAKHTQASYQFMIYFIVGIGLVDGVRLLSNYLSQVYYARMGQNIIERARVDLVKHLFKLPISYFDQTTSGSLMTRVVFDLNSLTDFFQSGFVAVFGNIVSVFAIFIGLFLVQPTLSAFLLLIFIPVILACGLFSVRLRKSYEETRSQLSHLNSLLADQLFGIKTIKSLVWETQKAEESNRRIHQYAQAQMATTHNYALFHPVISLGLGLMLFFHFAVSLQWVGNGSMTLGQWVSMMTYMMMLYQPLVEITDRWNFFLLGLTGIQRIQEILEVPIAQNRLTQNRHTDEKDYSNKETSAHFEQLKMTRLSMTYPSGTPALQNVNWEVSRGEKVGIFGESGAGKSTLLQMIYGFYPPTQGTIEWHWKQSGVRHPLGVVEQFPFIFSGTVEENIFLFGTNSTSLQNLQEQFKNYELATRLLKEPQKYLHERGANLSMGEKQMLSFLRAFVVQPEIWILDEATAFFDEQAEQEVFRAMKEFSPHSTWIQVAHRPQALAQMSRWTQVIQGTTVNWQQLS